MRGSSPERVDFLLLLVFLIFLPGEEPDSPEIEYIDCCSQVPNLFPVHAYIFHWAFLSAGFSWSGKLRRVIKDIIYFSPVNLENRVMLRTLAYLHANHPTPFSTVPSQPLSEIWNREYLLNKRSPNRIILLQVILFQSGFTYHLLLKEYLPLLWHLLF